MSYNISKAKLENFSLFSLCSSRYGYGHFKRVSNLIELIKNKKFKFNHYSFDEKIESKLQFINLIKKELLLGKKVVLDITSENFLTKKIVQKLKKNIINSNSKKIYIIDSPLKKNLSSDLNLRFIKCLIPFEVGKDVYKKLSLIKKKLIGIDYFIYPKKKKITYSKSKKFKILLSFGASDNYKGTFYVLKLLSNLNLKNNFQIKVVIGKFFKKTYVKKINEICNKNNFKILNFSSNFNNHLIKSNLLITNSGLTKYESVINGIPVFVFSDTNKSQKIDKIFIKKTKQKNFSALKNQNFDLIKLNNDIETEFKTVTLNKLMIQPNLYKIKKFFLENE